MKMVQKEVVAIRMMLAALAFALLQAGWVRADEKAVAPTTNAPAQLASATATPSKAIRVLFIGNSYTYYNGGLGTIVQQMAMSVKDGRKMEFVEVTKGGQTLEGHWNDGKALAAIQKGNWDYVVLQEHSMRPLTDTEKMYQYAKLFNAEIQKVGAKTLFYETWARKNKPETQTGLCKAYETLAHDLNALVAPAGRAWEATLKAKPDFVLHVKDLSHPTPAGSYLNACVIYSTIFGRSPEGLPKSIRNAAGKVLMDLSDADAAMLQRAAAEIRAGAQKVETPDVSKVSGGARS